MSEKVKVVSGGTRTRSLDAEAPASNATGSRRGSGLMPTRVITGNDPPGTVQPKPAKPISSADNALSK